MHIFSSKIGDYPIQSPNVLKEINLGTEADKQQIYIRSKLCPKFEEKMVWLLEKYKDCFAWTYEEIPGLDQQLVEHELPIKPGYRPHIQPLRRISRDMEKLVADEIKKLIDVWDSLERPSVPNGYQT